MLEGLLSTSVHDVVIHKVKVKKLLCLQYLLVDPPNTYTSFDTLSARKAGFKGLGNVCSESVE